MEPNLAKAQKIMDKINNNPKEMELYEMRQKVRMDIKIARERNIQEGEEKGKEEEKIEIATKLKNKGFSNEEIGEITELAPKDIKKL